MTIRYVGAGGGDANNGTSWATRKLTLNGVEDTPVAAGDIVYVAPGVYRETLTVDVSGVTGSSAITYIGDVTGEHTSGIGGVVRITGSDDDKIGTRVNCITQTTKHWRVFQGFQFDTTTGLTVTLVTSTNTTIQDCVFLPATNHSINVSGATQLNCTIQRCLIFSGGAGYGISFTHSAAVDNSGHLVKNCVIVAGSTAINSVRVGGITVKNCTLRGTHGVRVETATTVGQTITVNNCLIEGCSVAGVRGTVIGEIVENYNSIANNTASRTSVATGTSSVGYPSLMTFPLLLPNYHFPYYMGELSQWSQVSRIAGTGELTEDYFGISRPSIASKNSWGAMQFTGAIRETGTVQAGTQSLKLPDAGEQFLMHIPTTAVSTTFSVYCYREAIYTGTNPQMILRQPGQSDVVVTDTGGGLSWNQLTSTFVPNASPPYVDMFVKSLNTSLTGSYAVYFDTVSVS